MNIAEKTQGKKRNGGDESEHVMAVAKREDLVEAKGAVMEIEREKAHGGEGRRSTCLFWKQFDPKLKLG